MDSIQRRGREFWVSLAALLGWNLMVYHRVCFLGEAPDGGDQNYLHYPWKIFFLESLREGTFPFWNPYPFCGTPFFHDIQTCTLYPPDWIYFLIPLPWGFGLSYFLHNLAAGVFFHRLAGEFLEDHRARLLSALVYSGSGVFVSRLFLGNAVVIASLAWAPLFLWVGIRLFAHPSLRRLAGFALVSALFILAGHPQIPFFTVQLLFVVLLFRSVQEFRTSQHPIMIAKGWGFVGAGGLLGLGITTVQVLPFLELAGYSATRAGGASYRFAAEGSMPVSHLLSLYLPFFFGDPATETYWGSLIPFPEICGYIGVVTLWLGFIGILPTRRSPAFFWGGVAVASVLLAMGEFAPLHPLFYSLVPGWNLFRQPGRVLFVFTVAGGLLAGYGLERIILWKRDLSYREVRMAGGALALATLLLLAAATYLGTQRDSILSSFADQANRKYAAEAATDPPRFVPENFIHRYEGMRDSVFHGLALTAVLGLTLMAWVKIPRWREGAVLFLILLTAVDLYLFGHRFLNTLPPREWIDLRHPRSALAANLSEMSEAGRILQPDTALDYRFRNRHPEFYPNGPMAQGIRTVRGYSATILSPYSRFINHIQNRPEEELPGGLLILDRIDTVDPLNFSVMNVHTMLDYQPHSGAFEVVDKRSDGMYVHRLKEPLPRVFRAGPADNRWGLLPLGSERRRAEVVEADPNRVAVRTEGETPAELVFSESGFPGWKALVNGEEVPITEAFRIFQKVTVPAGVSEVVWDFRPRRIGLYGILSGMSLLACLSLFMLGATSPPRPPSSTGVLAGEKEEKSSEWKEDSVTD